MQFLDDHRERRGSRPPGGLARLVELHNLWPSQADSWRPSPLVKNPFTVRAATRTGEGRRADLKAQRDHVDGLGRGRQLGTGTLKAELEWRFTD